MPNITVPAAGGAMPAAKFDRTAIMQAARASYRDWHARQERIHGPCPFNRSEFAIWNMEDKWAPDKIGL